MKETTIKAKAGVIRSNRVTSRPFVPNEVQQSSEMVSSEEHLRHSFQSMPVQRRQARGNSSGLPDRLKSGIESLSGMSMDHVKVHYNSSKPAQLQAHAYAQGNEIHVGRGQEKHLAHEAWHVVQQRQGRVRPNLKLGNVGINDNSGLEREADVMGGKALQVNANRGYNSSESNVVSETINNQSNQSQTVQPMFRVALGAGRAAMLAKAAHRVPLAVPAPVPVPLALPAPAPVPLALPAPAPVPLLPAPDPLVGCMGAQLVGGTLTAAANVLGAPTDQLSRFLSGPKPPGRDALDFIASKHMQKPDSSVCHQMATMISGQNAAQSLLGQPVGPYAVDAFEKQLEALDAVRGRPLSEQYKVEQEHHAHIQKAFIKDLINNPDSGLASGVHLHGLGSIVAGAKSKAHGLYEDVVER